MHKNKGGAALLTVNKEKMKYEEGMTIDDILKKKKYSFPLITVVVNGEVIPREQYSTYKVEDGDNIDVIHIMSGG
ncbi:MAG TPA: sulfur carrier protein ThiS [Thermoanaerobacterales bacterium]|nr:sulfur carrier protein ThiS [Thermoanaerobacterales bacterium]